MPILFYFTRFTMKRGNAGSWNSGWKRSKHWKPILHCSKSPETPRNMFLELIRIIERKKYIRGTTPCPGEWRAPPYWARHPISWAPWWASGVHLLLYEGFYPGKNRGQAYGTKLHRHEAEPWRNQSRALVELSAGTLPSGRGKSSPTSSLTILSSGGGQSPSTSSPAPSPLKTLVHLLYPILYQNHKLVPVGC